MPPIARLPDFSRKEEIWSVDEPKEFARDLALLISFEVNLAMDVYDRSSLQDFEQALAPGRGQPVVTQL